MYSNWAQIVLNNEKPTSSRLLIQERHLVDDSNLFSIGTNKFETDKIFYSIIEKGITAPMYDFGQILSISVFMDDDVIEERRQVYSFWDYIGDIGGLNDFLQIIGGVLMSLFTTLKGSGLDRLLTERIFFLETETKSGKLRRKPARFNLFMWLKKDKKAKDQYA